MRPLLLALSAVGLALAVSGCGSGRAESTGPAPSVPVETAPPAMSPSGTAELPTTNTLRDYSAQIVEYVAQADAICKTATDKLEAFLAALPEGASLYGTEFDNLAWELSGQALAQLRALPPPESGAVNPVALCSHRGGSQDSGPTREEFIAQADEVCRGLHITGAAGYEGTVRRMEEILAGLRALPQPEADRALLEEGVYQVMEQEIYALRESLAAHAAGDFARAALLVGERVALTHQKGASAGAYGLREGCPAHLGA